jgi:hypothetical protein
MPTAQRELRIKSLVTGLSAALALGGAASAPANSLAGTDWSSYSLRTGSLGMSSTHRFGVKALPPAPSTIRNVLSCADDGSVGSLRQVIGVAADGDYIDLSGLACSTITLVSGEIATARNGLTLHGPTDHTLTITTSAYNRLLHHTGSGYLTIDHLRLSGGKYSSSSADAIGGCVNSSGGLNVYSSIVTGCMVEVTATGTFPSRAIGGAIYAKRLLTLSRSQITGNSALGFNNNKTYGGGVFSHGLTCDYCTFSGNGAYGTSIGTGIASGGAALVIGGIYLVESTLDSNQADIGGAIYQSGSASDSLTVKNSTISGNKAVLANAGISAVSPLGIYNTTVAFNSTQSGAAIYDTANVVADSSIMAKNSVSLAGAADLYVRSPAVLTGSHNLIVSSNVGLPGTLTGNPRLAPLANHGGPTRTHALLPLSPAINVGNNVFGSIYEQRGSGYLREVPSGSPDIGAYERQLLDDEIFYDGLE